MLRPARHLCVGFAGQSITPELRSLVRRGVRAVSLRATNAGTPDEVRALCSAIRALTDEPILIAVDHEGGSVQHLQQGFAALPALRDVPTPEKAHQLGRLMAAELRSVGVDLNLAPVVDVDSNPANPVIGARAFGADPKHVAACCVAMIQGMHVGGLAACAKHFPGHGDTDLDSHALLPRLNHTLERLESIELVPFRAAMRAGVDAIMTAHIEFAAVDPGAPATLSPTVIDGLLRCEMGYTGVVISDDLEMDAITRHHDIAHAAIRAVAAGVDLVLCCSNPDRQHAILDALDDAARHGALDSNMLIASATRLDRLLASRATLE